MKELKDYSDLELRALKADMFEQRDSAINNLQVISQELQRRANLPKEEVKEIKAKK